MTEIDPAGAPVHRSGRALVIAGLASLALYVAYLAAGMPGMDHGPSGDEGPMASMDHGRMGYASLSSEDFASQMSQGAFVVNVHRPYEGEIDGTDAFIEYDEIGGDGRLPADTDTPILLYCQSGRMSAVAADALVDAGYTDVAHLDGGMEAWKAAGMPLARQRP
jgi:rhodanese-related sulfurtransferase